MLSMGSVLKAKICEAVGGAKCYYVSPTGNDANPGTFALPHKTFRLSVTAAQPGDFIYAMGGIYGDSNLTQTGWQQVATGVTSCPPGQQFGQGDKCYVPILTMIPITNWHQWPFWSTSPPAGSPGSGLPGNL